ncbi:MAG: HlyC/CorC family transporter [Clostridiales bacterium]|jgi:CBS domain containing-hemolysin-like protein|nr:HlyC/CorC family transporter [Clostridiales bacterium]
MDSDSLGKIILLAIFILFSAFFSATETAFSSLNRIRIKSIAGEGNKNAQLIMKLSENYDRLISTVLIGNNIVNIAATSLAAVIFIKHFGNIGVTISTAVMTVIILLFGEISPKSMAKDSPESFARFSAPIINIFYYLLYPLNFAFSLWKKLLIKLFKPSAVIGVTEEELLTMVDEAENDGGIDSAEGELIRNAIEFGDTEAEDIYTPRVDVVAVNIDMDKADVEAVFSDSGYSRLPVYRETIDNIVGIINQKDFRAPENTDCTLEQMMKPPVFVIPSINMDELLKTLQKTKSHLAVIADEFGGTMGIVTLEDVLEELVGEIWDEQDEVIEEFVQLSENEYRVLCTADLNDMFEHFGIEEETDISKVSGWVIRELDRIPRVGDSFTYGKLNVTVTKCDQRRALEIVVRISEPQPEE